MTTELETPVFAVFQCKTCFKLRPLIYEPTKRHPAPRVCDSCGKKGVTKKLATSMTYAQIESLIHSRSR
jgi:rRNA maturation endonuclease Nob1